MSLLSFLGLDELAESVTDLTSSIDELRQEVVSSIKAPAEEIKGTVTDLIEDVTK